MTLSLGDDEENVVLLMSAISENGSGGARTDITDELPPEDTEVEEMDED